MSDPAPLRSPPPPDRPPVEPLHALPFDPGPARDARGPHRLRTLLACSLAAALLGLGASPITRPLGLDVSSPHPFLTPLMRLGGMIEPAAPGELRGTTYGYRLKLPNDRWYLRTARSMKKEGSTADRWLVRPDQDTNVLVIVSRAAPGATYDVERLAQAVVDTARANSKDFALLESRPIAGLPDPGRLLHTTATMGDLRVEQYYGVFARGDRAVQLITLSEPSRFKALQPELEQLLRSFEFPP